MTLDRACLVDPHDVPRVHYRWTAGFASVAKQVETGRLEKRGSCSGSSGVGWQRSPKDDVAVTGHEGSNVRLDNDNFVKPIQDALNSLVYDDDRQLTDIIVRKASIDLEIFARGKSLVLLAGFARGEPFVHIIVRAAPDHAQPIG